VSRELKKLDTLLIFNAVVEQTAATVSCHLSLCKFCWRRLKAGASF
jgi:hypothetical protein